MQYQNLIRAVERHAMKLGMEVSVQQAPDYEHYPVILNAKGIDDQSLTAMILLFPQAEPFFNSDVIGYVAHYLRDAATLDLTPIIIYNDSALPRLKKILETTGLDKYALSATYKKTEMGYTMDWGITRPDVKAPS